MRRLSIRRGALGLCLLAAACGKRGPLQAPRRALPEPPALSASRVGGELRVVVTHRGLRENGRPLAGAEQARVTFSAGALVVEQAAPASGHRAALRWPLPPGPGELTVSARWVDGRNRPSEPSAAATFKLEPLAEPVTAFAAENEPGGIRLRFTAAAGAKALRLYEALGADESVLAEIPAGTTDWLVPGGRGARRFILRALVADAPETLSAGRDLSAQWADRWPPAAPKGLQAFAGEEGVELYWQPPEDDDAATAVIERSAAGGPFVALAEIPAGDWRHLDLAPPANVPLIYRVRLADRAEPRNLSPAAEATARWQPPIPGGMP